MKFIVDNWLLLVVALTSGGMLLWPMLKGGGFSAALSAPDAVQLINRQKAVVIDVSEAEEFAKSHVRGAKNVPLSQLEARLPALVKNKALPLILVCPSGARARRALATAKKLGYDHAQTLAGGLKGWRDANLPVEGAS